MTKSSQFAYARQMPQQPPATEAERLIGEISKLCRHVEALQRDVTLLTRRITPFEDGGSEGATPAPPWTRHVEWGLAREKVSLPLIREIVRQADGQLKGAEADIRYIRSRIDEISNDTYLRADMKKWIDEANDDEA